MISSILLAAGQSKRMGGENKLAKKFQGIPLIKHSLKNILESSVDEIIVVLGYQKENIERLIDKNDRIRIVFNENFENGISSSIKLGLKNISKNADAFFICLADMPKVNFYNKIISIYMSNKNKSEIFIPTYKNKQTNPILFTRSMESKIMSIQGDFGAKQILELYKNKILNININDFSILKDFDVLDDFAS
tara:strand:+ start:613 stop:1188 length:576 start_codon:yes stop_codon:yes gene_type:complete